VAPSTADKQSKAGSCSCRSARAGLGCQQGRKPIAQEARRALHDMRAHLYARDHPRRHRHGVASDGVPAPCRRRGGTITKLDGHENPSQQRHTDGYYAASANMGNNSRWPTNKVNKSAASCDSGQHPKACGWRLTLRLCAPDDGHAVLQAGQAAKVDGLQPLPERLVLNCITSENASGMSNAAEQALMHRLASLAGHVHSGINSVSSSRVAYTPPRVAGNAPDVHWPPHPSTTQSASRAKGAEENVKQSREAPCSLSITINSHTTFLLAPLTPTAYPTCLSVSYSEVRQTVEAKPKLPLHSRRTPCPAPAPAPHTWCRCRAASP
jgi:hypothetical protein